jgi:ABC-type transport system involved in multi-copper enzyme maturation permease subunit
MTLPAALLAIGWMIRDTLRQSLASRLFWVMVAVSAVCIVFCLGVRTSDRPRPPLAPGETSYVLPKDDPQAKKLGPDRVVKDGVEIRGGDQISLGFGAFTIEAPRGKADSVRFLQVWLAGLAAGTAGIFLCIIWTAGFLPQFLDPNHATVLLAKPVPRWSLLLGKVLGVLAFVLIQATFFVFGTWLALGISTGVFDARYLFAIPVLLLHFAAFYGFSAMLAVWTRSTVVCVFGTLLFWVICWAMNYGRHTIVAHEPAGMSAGSRVVLEIGYWALPKPADLNVILDDALDTRGFAAGVPEVERAREKGRLNLPMSALSSLLFAVVIFGVSAWEFRNAEY